MLPNTSWPQIVDLRDAYRANGATPIPHDFALITGSDHRGGTEAGITIRFIGNGDGRADPRNPATWQASTETKIIDLTNGGSSCETPRLMFSEALNKWLLYFQTSDSYGISTQHTRIFQATEIDTDKAGWTDTGVHIALTATDAGRYPSDGHTGYFHPFRPDANRWMATSLLGGTDYSTSGMWYSDDGLNWSLDPRPLYHEAHLNPVPANTLSSLGISHRTCYFKHQGTWKALVKEATISSGASTADETYYVAEVTDDFRCLVGNPSKATFDSPAWLAGETGRIFNFFEYAGDLYGVLVAANSRRIGLARMVF